MSLRDSLQSVRPESLAIVSVEGDLTYGDLFVDSVVHEHVGSDSCLRLGSENIVEFARGIVRYDGIIGALLLEPRGLSATGSEMLMKDARAWATTADIGSGGKLSHKLNDRDPRRTRQHGYVATRWLLATSGTTSQPKLVGHTFAGLRRRLSVNKDATGSWRWGLVYDGARFAGLQVLLQALLCGSVLIAPSLADDVEKQLRFLAQHDCNALSATPTFYRQACMTSLFQTLPLRQITLGGELADQRLLTTLRLLFPSARITHIYASTEAGVGFSVTDGLAGFPVAYLTHPPKDVRLQINGNRLYIHNSDVNERYVGSATAIRDASGWVDTGDVVEVRENRVYFLGRASGVINIGGNKVHPEEVESVLLEYPAVIQARVYAKRSAVTGAVVVADVVLSDSTIEPSTALSDLMQALRSRLPRHKIPALINPVATISTTTAAKISRVAT